MAADTQVNVDGKQVALSNLDKILWPEEGYTKGDLIDYYAKIAPYILPHLQDRPLVFTRYPDGIKGKSFYQKNAPAYLPEWIETLPWKFEDDVQKHLIMARKKADLVWLANQAVIEIHPWFSRPGTIDYPDFVVFDLDPSAGSTFEQVVTIAKVLKQILDELKLKSYLKTSGAEGLHIYVPLVNQYAYSELRDFSGKIAGMACLLLPEIATIERNVKKRGTRVYVDFMQNVLGKTLCAPYSVRPRAGATVSTPLKWEEIDTIKPSDFNIRNIFARLDKVGDLFAPVLTEFQSLEEACQSLGLRRWHNSLLR